MGFNVFNYKYDKTKIITKNISKQDTIKFIPPIQFGKVIQIYDANTISPTLT